MKNSSGFTTPPIHKGSTVLYESLDDLYKNNSDSLHNQGNQYGRFGCPNSRQFEQLICQIEGGGGAFMTGSGLSAITTAIFSLVEVGDHILIVDTVYSPVRRFCESLKKFGVVTEYYPAHPEHDLEKKIRPNTRLVYLESPGSLTFEFQNLETIIETCKKKGVLTMIDNTWSTPYHLAPLRLGIDVSIHSCTKYIAGHSDSISGVVITTPSLYPQLRKTALDLGERASPDDAYMAIRGLKTLKVRLNAHQISSRQVADFLSQSKHVQRVLHPALESCPGHEFWKKYYTGFNGLLSFQLKKESTLAQDFSWVEKMKVFNLGYSWGGHESLIIPFTLEQRRQQPWYDQGPFFRLHMGLNSSQDQIQDLKQAGF